MVPRLLVLIVVSFLGAVNCGVSSLHPDRSRHLLAYPDENFDDIVASHLKINGLGDTDAYFKILSLRPSHHERMFDMVDDFYPIEMDSNRAELPAQLRGNPDVNIESSEFNYETTSEVNTPETSNAIDDTNEISSTSMTESIGDVATNTTPVSLLLKKQISILPFSSRKQLHPLWNKLTLKIQICPQRHQRPGAKG